MAERSQVPTFSEFHNPVLQALHALGGSGTIPEINARAIEIMGISDEVAAVPHDPQRGSQSQVEYRMAWARSYLKKVGLVDNSERAVWSLTAEGRRTKYVDGRQVSREVSRILRDVQAQAQESPEADTLEPDWRTDLAQVLAEMTPGAFERLVQRLLRESGFVQVEVTGRSGDGGIDGKGIMRLAGLLSFHVVFQAKRWKGTVGAATIRDFRGAMIGRADKGILITTGDFTPDAQREASRAGAPPIDLVDGEQLMDKLKQLSLGVTTKPVTVEQVTVDEDWYAGL